ncbi:SMI1/KNR4 family protein [Marinitenerispora sediminis]|uniref:SMI1/KNR4 family protein n=1 Tax=Marinitenerispora sediminis TaxID=1931232 RepID=UPI00131478DD|nr:SMI1/KNR4 family protein [Marinitenerispora sediminis]
MFPPIDESWRRILDWTAAHLPHALASGAGDDELRAAEKRLGFPLPPELRLWWSLERPDGVELAPFHHFVDLDTALDIRDSALSFHGPGTGPVREPHGGGTPPPDEGTAGTPPHGYSPRFLPIAEDGAGDHLYVDLRDGERHGCVMRWEHDGVNDETAEWLGLAHLLDDIAGALENGRPAGLRHYRDQGEPVTEDSGYVPVLVDGAGLEWRFPEELRTDKAAAAPADGPSLLAVRPMAAPLAPMVPQQFTPAMPSAVATRSSTAAVAAVRTSSGRPQAGDDGDVAGALVDEAVHGTTLLPGQALRRQSLTSASGEYTLIHQDDGNLVLYRNRDGLALWASNTWGTEAGTAELGQDGDLVLSDADGDPLWRSGTAGRPGARLVVGDDGDTVLYGADGGRLWATGTVQRPLPEGPVARGAVMLAGQTLRRQSLTSPSGDHTLVYQDDGNLVLYCGPAGRALWATGTDGCSVGVLTLYGDGDLVLHDTHGAPLWRTGTAGNPGARLEVGDDGDVVLRGADGMRLWGTGTRRREIPTGPPARGAAMRPGEVLAEGTLASPSGAYRFVHQDDGNLVLYSDRDGRALWATGTDGCSVGVLALYVDGNLVLSDAHGHPLWRSGTAGRPGARLVVGDDGDVVLYGADGARLWATGTKQRGVPSGPPAQGAVMRVGEVLARGALASPSGEFRLVHQDDGNLVLYARSHPGALWASNTHGATVGALALHEDGGLVLHDAQGHPVWRSHAAAGPGAELRVEDSGCAVLCDAEGTVLWRT